MRFVPAAVRPLRPLALAAAVALGGCSSQPPSCTDAATVALAKRVLHEQLLPPPYRDIDPQVFDAAVSIEQPAPIAYDERMRQFSCQARLAVDSSAGTSLRDVPATLGHVLVDLFVGQRQRLPDWECDDAAQRCYTPVGFTSQKVEGRHVVNVSGISGGEASLIGMYVAQHEAQARTAAQK